MAIHTHTTNCSGDRCPEQQHVDYTTEAELAAIQAREWRCALHQNPDRILTTEENPAT